MHVENFLLKYMQKKYNKIIIKQPFEIYLWAS